MVNIISQLKHICLGLVNEFFSNFSHSLIHGEDFPGSMAVKNPSASAGNARDVGLISGSERSPRVGNDTPTLVFWPGKFHGHKSLAGYSP